MTAASAMPASSDERVLIIEPDRLESNYWRDHWRYRELLFVLAWRDIAVRYKQTVVGVIWALIRPFATMVVFTIVFGRIAKLPAGADAPYAVMVFAGMLPWFLMAGVVSEASESLVANANLLGKVYFPRLIVPIAASVVVVVDFLVNLAMLGLVLVWFGFVPSWHVLFLPVAAVAAIATGLGPAVLLAALNVRYRDFRYVMPFVIQFGLYVSPVGFSSDVVPAKWRLLYDLNPAVGIIDLFRWCIIGGTARLDGVGLLVNAVTVAALLWLGLRYFRRTERAFADVI